MIDKYNDENIQKTFHFAKIQAYKKYKIYKYTESTKETKFNDEKMMVKLSKQKKKDKTNTQNIKTN